MQLYLLTSAEGMPLMWCLANPKLGEREVMTAMPEADHHLVAEGQVILADKDFAVAEFEQLIEAVFDTLKGRLSLE